MTDVQGRRDGKKSPPRSGTGREELRSTWFRPYLLRLRDERGEPVLRALLSTAGIPIGLMNDDAGWLSVDASKRLLRAIASAFGPEAVAERGAWMTHPETLGAYVRMLRVASAPEDAYRYLAANASETTRVGSCELKDAGASFAEIIYRPRQDTEESQADELLCAARRAELAAIPLIWGLPAASIEHPRCLARGDSECHYVVRWRFGQKRSIALGAILGAAASGGAVMISGSLLAAGIGAGVGAGLGAALGLASERVTEERSLRVFEKHRIAALERGLEVRGHFRDAVGDMVDSVLGGKYRIIKKIGSGGIGVVYAAEHVTLGTEVAVKVLRGAAAMDASEIARLRREARVQGSIEHPNVVRTLDLDELPDGSIYVVMELLRGFSLASMLKADGLVAPGFAVPMFAQVCRALWAAHQLGVVHRDLKPGNIFICDDKLIKVLDFGMSKFNEAEKLTQDGYTLGTPEYMAPEQCIGAPVDGRTDLYALGVMMFEAVTGDLPIRGRNRRDLLELHQRAIPRSILETRPDLPLPEGLSQAIAQCLRKRAAERPTNARELEKLLEVIPLEGLPDEYGSDVPRHPSDAPSLRSLPAPR
ncbi:MAG TPA: serine/threonine-protein kinase [Polyangiaceae bacterium]|nr:serine/threonine-protein kinase [Polyangiaceae bacterium]